jgi:acetylornithine deacetylase
MNSDIASLIAGWSEETADLLATLITFQSTVGNEQPVQEYLARYAGKLGLDPRLVSIHPNIESDEDYTLVPGHKGYEGRANLVITIPGTGGGRSIILNSHVDVVPAPSEIFEGKVENGVCYGRGACDAKGNVVTILLALRALKEAGIRLKGDVIASFVIEEEAGGNGALSFILDGYRADGVIVLESTDLNVAPANRGAVWFDLGIEGKPAHMGRWREGVNAIEEMMEAVRVLKDYERKLVAESGGDPLFPDPEASVKVNIGTIEGGDWPSMVAGHCRMEGGIGFLPNKRLSDIRSEVREAIEHNAGEWAKTHYELAFRRLHNEAYAIPPDHPLAVTLRDSADSEIFGMTASCDARLFYHRGGMPTVVFGPGKFPYAHAADEQISVRDMDRGAGILVDFLMRWCGA